MGGSRLATSYVSSTGSHRESHGQNVFRSIRVTIVNRAAGWTYPFPSVQRKRVKHPLAGMTGLRRRVPPVNLDEGPPVPLGFVLQLAHQLPPTHITDRLGETRVLNQILDHQALHTHHLVFVDDACTQLVLVVSSSISHFRVDLGHFQSSLGPILGTILFLGELALSLRQFLLVG